MSNGPTSMKLHKKTRVASVSSKSAITAHMTSENQLIDWENVKVMDHDYAETEVRQHYTDNQR